MKKILKSFWKPFSFLLFLNLIVVPLSAEPSEISPDILSFSQQLQKANTFYETVKNYEGSFYKTESKDGVLDETEDIFLRFEKPFKIFMGWEGGKKKGLQVFYERGRFDNKLVVHQPGVLLGLVQIVYLEQSSPWVREGSASFNIEDAGIGTFLSDFTKAVNQATTENKLKVKALGPKDQEGLKGDAFEVTFENTKKDDIYFAYRIIVIMDSENFLPVSEELYDWENKSLGIYQYKNLKFNVPDASTLKPHMHRALFKIYTPETPTKKVSKASSNFNKHK